MATSDSGYDATVRLVSYNILDGGVGRADPIAEVLLAQRADVIGLVEADDAEILDRIAWRLGWDYIAAEGREGRTAALLTRGRILESVNHAQLIGERGPRSFLEAMIEVGKATLPIGVIHLTAKATAEAEQTRERELTEVLRVFADRRKKGERHVIVGDFNANAPIQQIERATLKKSSQTAWDDNGGDLLRGVMQRILGAGYVDSLATAHPEDAATMGTFSTDSPGQRVDYILCFGFEAGDVVDAWIETDRLAKYASDHFPVGSELRR